MSSAAPSAAAIRLGTAEMPIPRSCARPFAAAQPIRRPVKLPGPSATTSAARSRARAPAAASARSTSVMIWAACWRAPFAATTLRTSRGLPAAALAISVAVSMASQTSPIKPSSIADCGLGIAESKGACRIRNRQSAIRNHDRRGRPSPDLLQLPEIRRLRVAQLELPIQWWDPRAGALGPFDQDDGALAYHVVEPEVTGLVGRLEAIAVHVVHGAAGAVFVMMHQSVCRARGLHARPQAAADCLDQRGLAAAKLARQPDHSGRGELAAEVLTEPVELVRAQAQGAP